MSVRLRFLFTFFQICAPVVVENLLRVSVRLFLVLLVFMHLVHLRQLLNIVCFDLGLIVQRNATLNATCVC
jgi:hypothetical protein